MPQDYIDTQGLSPKLSPEEKARRKAEREAAKAAARKLGPKKRITSKKYQSDNSTMHIKEIFMIGPSISVLIDGYVEKNSGLVSLRGTMVPAKALNTLVSKIPVVGEILVGKKIGEGVFGLSFKIKGLPNNLKTTVNPVKTLAPRFITRALEAAKKKKSKEQ